jgi:PAS domain S-box-containing protein
LDESAIVAITDQKGIIKHVNNNFCKISKYSKEELIGQDHRIINSGYHSKEFIRNLWVTIANGKIWRGELRNKAKDGTIYWVDTTIVPFLNEEAKPYQYLAIRSDITQRKLAEEQLLKINEDLENKVKERTLELTYALEKEKELNEMKSRFVSIASHEFRTPLSAILSSTSLVDHYINPDQEEKRKKHIDRIKSSVRNLTSILDDFLSLEKLEQGKVEAHSSEFNLKEFIDDVIDEMDGMVKRKQQKVNFNYDGDEEVYQDKKILRNVLLNLLSNAVKYSPEGKEIHVSTVVKDGKVSVAIRDEGIGIPADAQKNMFDKFFRAKNATNIQGTGLGLNIVKRYVELLDGTISFTSKENIGTSFTVEFPKNKKD